MVFHLDVALILEKGGYRDATLMAFKTAALLHCTLNPLMRATVGAFIGQILWMQIFHDLAKSDLIAEVLASCGGSMIERAQPHAPPIAKFNTR